MKLDKGTLNCYMIYTEKKIIFITKFLVLLVLLIFSSMTFAEDTEIRDFLNHSDNRKVITELRNNIDFWKLVYGHYRRNTFLLHDSRYPNIIYSIIEISEAESSQLTTYGEFPPIALDSKNRIYQLLMRLHKKSRYSLSLTDEEDEIDYLLKELKGKNKFKNAAKSLKIQRGKAEEFTEAKKRAILILPQMANIFIDYDLPVPLTNLPFIESLFDQNAVSPVGATGLWQFMRATGRAYLKINKSIDERTDPLKSTLAAARYIKYMHSVLKNWPLTVLAYNYGIGELYRASKRLKTKHLPVIITKNRSRSFGFSAKNFYTSFMAINELLYESSIKTDSISKTIQPVNYELVNSENL